ncbi:MAG TPA: hypothetical protein VF600_16665 [Abditibacteriaceae bacterium]|jgi:high-affinity nickel-transport protein
MNSINEVSLWTTLAIGLMLGAKHALDTDHLMALSTLVVRERNLKRASLIGAAWGIGHTSTLLFVGLLVIGMRWKISERLALSLDLLVALMLIVLGVRSLMLWKCEAKGLPHGAGERLTHPAPAQSHNEYSQLPEPVPAVSAESHAHVHRHASPSAMRSRGKQSFLVGAVHGLNGSAALMLLVLSTIVHPLWGMFYIVLFGIGSVGGMLLMSTLFSVAMRLTTNRFKVLDGHINGAAGLASLLFGIFVAYQIGIVEGLFLA